MHALFSLYVCKTFLRVPSCVPYVWCWCLFSGRKDADASADTIDIPKRTTPAKGNDWLAQHFNCMCGTDKKAFAPNLSYFFSFPFFCLYPINHSCCLWPICPLPLTYLPALAFSPAGYELLYQLEVVRIYTSLLKESKNPTVLEASAGAIQNLCAGRWTVREPLSVIILFRFTTTPLCVEQTHQLSNYDARLLESEQTWT